MLAATAALLLVLVPPPRILAPMALLLSLATAEFVVAWRARSPDALRLFADGRATVVIDGREMPVALGSGGMFGRGFALIWWRAGQRARLAGWALFLCRDNRAAWSRARCIWRWAPRGAAAPLV